MLPSGEIVHFGGKAAESYGYDMTGFLVGLGRDDRHRHRDHGEVAAQAGKDCDPAGHLRVGGRRGANGFCHYRCGHYSRRAGDAGWMDVAHRRSVLPCRLSAGCGRGAADRTGRTCAKRWKSRRWRCARFACDQKAREVRRAKDEEERALLWKGRKMAFAALGRVTPRTTPRTEWCRAVRYRRCCGTSGMSPQKYDLIIGNIFHAGDGNLHPLILFDMRYAEQLERVLVGQPRHPGILHSMRRLYHRRARRRDGEARPDVACCSPRKIST